MLVIIEDGGSFHVRLKLSVCFRDRVFLLFSGIAFSASPNGYPVLPVEVDRFRRAPSVLT